MSGDTRDPGRVRFCSAAPSYGDATRAETNGAHLLAKARSFGWLDDGLGVGFDTGLVTITMHSAGTFSGRYRDVLRDRAGLIGNVDLDTLLDWLRSRLS